MAAAFKAELEVPFPSSEEAEIALGSLSVDKEPRRSGVQRTITVSGSNLLVHFEAQEARSLRVSINSFFEHVHLVCETIRCFGQQSQ